MLLVGGEAPAAEVPAAAAGTEQQVSQLVGLLVSAGGQRVEWQYKVVCWFVADKIDIH